MKEKVIVVKNEENELKKVEKKRPIIVKGLALATNVIFTACSGYYVRNFLNDAFYKTDIYAEKKLHQLGINFVSGGIALMLSNKIGDYLYNYILNEYDEYEPYIKSIKDCMKDNKIERNLEDTVKSDDEILEELSHVLD